MIFNKNIVSEKYGTSFPFYPIQDNDPLVQSILSHMDSCTLFLPVGMLPPVRIYSVSADTAGKEVYLRWQDKNGLPFGVLTLAQGSSNQSPIWSDDHVLMGYVDISDVSGLVKELITGLSGAVDYRIAGGSLRVLPYCTHTVQLPTPAVVSVGQTVPESVELGRGLMFNDMAAQPGLTKQNAMSISLYADTPIGDFTSVPVVFINGVAQPDIVWITQKDPEQDITVKTYDHILIQGYSEQ